MKSCLLILLNDRNSDIYHSFIKNKIIQYFYFYNDQADEDNEDIIYCLEHEKAFVVTSKMCGVGKSSKINDIFKSLDNSWNYIYFPLRGKFNREQLINRVNLLPDMNDENNEKFLIHIDLNQLEELLLTKVFLFKILILKKFDIYDNIKYFGKNVKFYIEFSNDYVNYLDEIKILNIFEIININDLIKIKEYDALTTVSSILLINESKEISQKNYDMKLKKPKITHEQSNEIILNYLKKIGIENPNFYQINIFVRILYEEFIKLIDCNAFSPEVIKNKANFLGIPVEKVLEKRKTIIDSLINSVKLFFFAPYGNIIKKFGMEDKEPIINNNEKNEIYEVNNIIYSKKQKIIKILSNQKDNIIYDINNISLLCFINGKYSYSLLIDYLEKNQEYKILEKNIININNINNINNNEEFRKRSRTVNLKFDNKNEETKIKNIKSLQPDEMLDIILNFLNINDLDYQRKKDILDNYIFNSDNFIKMLLILKRIRVSLPIILMGEAGIGKYSLIEILSKIINKGKSKVHKMSINSGTTDEDIINFIKNIKKSVEREQKTKLDDKLKNLEEISFPIKKASTISNKKLGISNEFQKEIDNQLIFIFFDEFNACYSMGLISEILCKNTIYGEPLDKRFVFIASCKPYCFLSEDNNLNQFIKKNKKNNLVYELNPLPLSLLNFVIDFGKLKKEDEEKYIKSMIKKHISLFFEKENI